MTERRSDDDARLTRDDQAAMRRQAKDAKVAAARQRFDEMTAPVVADLHRRGVACSRLDYLVADNDGLPGEAIDVLLAWMPRMDDERVVETMVRQLAAARSRFSGTVLKDMFDKFDDYAFQWAIMNTIACARPLDIEGWAEELLQHPHWGQVLRDLGFRKRRRRPR